MKDTGYQRSLCLRLYEYLQHGISVQEKKEIKVKTAVKTMKITNTVVNNVVEETVGKDAVKIVDYLKDRKNISDFKIAESTKLNIQLVRNLLYQLNAWNMVTYMRKKDRLKGWYISYFTFNRAAIKDVMEKIRKDKLEKFQERLENEESGKVFFICSNLCSRLDIDAALQFDFKCPECGKLLNQQDNTKTKEHLKQKIKELQIAG
jgi:transcription initiation factor TFIIE subunit alpha